MMIYPMMTPDDVCKVLKISRSSLARAVADGVFQPIRLGKIVRFRAEDVEDFARDFRAEDDEPKK